MSTSNISAKAPNTTPIVLYKPPETTVPPWLFPVTMAVSMTTFLVISFALHHRRFVLKRRRLCQQNYFVLRHRRVAGPGSLANFNQVAFIDKPPPPKKLWGSKRLRRCYSWSPKFIKNRGDNRGGGEATTPDGKTEMSTKLMRKFCNVQEGVSALSRQASNKFSRLSGKGRDGSLNKTSYTNNVAIERPEHQNNRNTFERRDSTTLEPYPNPLSTLSIPLASTEDDFDSISTACNEEVRSDSLSSSEECSYREIPLFNVADNLQEQKETTDFDVPLADILQKTFRALTIHLASANIVKESETRTTPSINVFPSEDGLKVTLSERLNLRENRGQDKQGCYENLECERNLLQLNDSGDQVPLVSPGRPRRCFSRRKRYYSNSDTDIIEDLDGEDSGIANMCLRSEDCDVFVNSPNAMRLSSKSNTANAVNSGQNDKAIINTLEKLFCLFLTNKQQLSTTSHDATIEFGDAHQCVRCNEAKRLLSHISVINEPLNTAGQVVMNAEPSNSIDKSDLSKQSPPKYCDAIKYSGAKLSNTGKEDAEIETPDSPMLQTEETTIPAPTPDGDSYESLSSTSGHGYLDGSLTSLHNTVNNNDSR